MGLSRQCRIGELDGEIAEILGVGGLKATADTAEVAYPFHHAERLVPERGFPAVPGERQSSMEVNEPPSNRRHSRRIPSSLEEAGILDCIDAVMRHQLQKQARRIPMQTHMQRPGDVRTAPKAH